MSQGERQQNRVAMTVVHQLRDVRLLQDFPDEALEALARSGETMTFESHSNIVIEGEPTWGLYCILKGSVGVFKANRITKDMTEIAQLQQGSSFGEMSLIDDAPRSATVQSLTECELFYLSKDAFHAYLNRSPQLKQAFYESSLRELCRRLRELDDHYVISQYQLWKAALNKPEAA